MAQRRLAEKRVRLAVDEDVTARRIAACAGADHVLALWIVNPQRKVKATVGIATVDPEQPLGRLAVALPFLVALGREAKGYGIAAQRVPVAIDRQPPRRFLDQDAVDLAAERRQRRGRRFRQAVAVKRQRPDRQRRQDQDRLEKPPQPGHCTSAKAFCSRSTASTTRARGVARLKRRKLSPPAPKLAP